MENHGYTPEEREDAFSIQYRQSNLTNMVRKKIHFLKNVLFWPIRVIKLLVYTTIEQTNFSTAN